MATTLIETILEDVVRDIAEPGDYFVIEYNRVIYSRFAINGAFETLCIIDTEFHLDSAILTIRFPPLHHCSQIDLSEPDSFKRLSELMKFAKDGMQTSRIDRWPPTGTPAMINYKPVGPCTIIERLI